MQRCNGVAQRSTGQCVPFANVRVYEAGTDLATPGTIYSDDAGTLPIDQSTFTTDQTGKYTFTGLGTFDIIWYSDTLQSEVQSVQLYDLAIVYPQIVDAAAQTADDSVQTAADRIQTAADRTQTGIDAATTAAAASAAAAVVNFTLNRFPGARLCATGPLPANTYDNGAAGVGRKLTMTATGVLNVDGAAVALNDYVVVPAEANGANNGIYQCTTAGAGGVAAVLTGASYANTPAGLGKACVDVAAGTKYAGWAFAVQQAPGAITIGTTSITFAGQAVGVIAEAAARTLADSLIQALLTSLSTFTNLALVAMPAESGYVAGIVGMDADGSTRRLALGVKPGGTVVIFKVSLPASCVDVAQFASTALQLMLQPMPPESGYQFALMALDPDGLTRRAALLVDLKGNISAAKLNAGSADILGHHAAVANADYIAYQRKDVNGYWQIETCIRAQRNKRIVLTSGNSDKTDPSLAYDSTGHGVVLYWDSGVAPGTPNQQYIRADGTGTPLRSVTGHFIRTSGDSLTESVNSTEGAPGGVTITTYPAQLAAMLGGDWLVTNDGMASQKTDHIACRIGGIPLTVSVAGDQIPASGAVAVTIVSPFRSPVTDCGPLAHRANSSLPCSVLTPSGAIVGVLSTDAGNNYFFTRSVAGVVTACPSGTAVAIDQQGKDQYIQAVGAIRNNYNEPRVFTDLAGIEGSIKTYEVRDFYWGCVNTRDGTEDTGSSQLATILADNATLAATYQDSFIDFYAKSRAPYPATGAAAPYYCQGLARVGIAATAQDIADIAAGRIPQSLTSVDTLHRNYWGYRLMAFFAYDLLVAKGWNR